MKPVFAATLWRDGAELLDLRRRLYGCCDGEDGDRRQEGVNKILAWRAQKQELPLALESTADIVDAVLRDEGRVLPGHSLRVLYAGAVARFITGIHDTRTTLAPPPIPPALLETRHAIVHRHLPMLCVLRRCAQDSLSWLWDWYWKDLDLILSAPSAPSLAQSGRVAGTGTSTSTGMKGKLEENGAQDEIRTILKTYLRARRLEIKTRDKRSTSTSRAAPPLLRLLSRDDNDQNPMPAHHLAQLTRVLVDEGTIIPSSAAKSAQGAFLVWDPLLLTLSSSHHAFLPDMLGRMILVLDTRGGDEGAKDKVGMWVEHVLTSEEWARVRRGEEGIVERVLGELVVMTGARCLGVVERVVGKDGGLEERWGVVVRAARGGGEDGDGEMDGERVGGEAGVGGGYEEMEVDQSRRGPGLRKEVGMPRREFIGVLPPGWEDDA